MLSFTKEAIALAESFAKQCSEIEILHATGAYDDRLINQSSHYSIISKLYTGDSDKLTHLVEQEIFDYFSKNNILKDKLKNAYKPWRNGLDSDLITIYIVGK